LAVSAFGQISIFALHGMKLWVALIVVASVVSGCIAYSLGRGIRDMREKVLDELGVARVYATAKEDDAYLSQRIERAKRIRILAVNAEMLLRNLPTPFKNALKGNTTLEVLVADPDSQLVDEMERMELADGGRQSAPQYFAGRPGRQISSSLTGEAPERRGHCGECE
jgi:hypothetical protein